MKQITAYLTFDGTCRQAMTFYAKCFGADLQLMLFSETHPNVPAESKDRIMHARINKDKPILMASDTMVGMPFQQGNNFSVSIECDSLPEIETFFTALGEDGKVTMPL